MWTSSSGLWRPRRTWLKSFLFKSSHESFKEAGHVLIDGMHESICWSLLELFVAAMFMHSCEALIVEPTLLGHNVRVSKMVISDVPVAPDLLLDLRRQDLQEHLEQKTTREI